MLPALLAAALAPAVFVTSTVQPGECTAFGRWRTTAPTRVYARERDPGRLAFTLPARTFFTGLSGRVFVTHPVRWALPRDYAPPPGSTVGGVAPPRLTRGTVVELLIPDGEGGFLARAGGRTFETMNYEGMEVPRAAYDAVRYDWWAKVRAPDGRVGWIWMDEAPHLFGVDGCGPTMEELIREEQGRSGRTNGGGP